MNVPLEKNITVLGYTSIQDLISHPLGTNYIHFEYMTQLSLLLFPARLNPSKPAQICIYGPALREWNILHSGR